MLTLERLTKVFGRNTAVDAVSFAVEKPGMVRIIGRSGAGKSTLLRMINRLTDATSGRITVEGRDITALKGVQKRAWQSRCAMIFQQFNLYPEADIHRAIEILDRPGISENAPRRSVAGSSSGWRLPAR